MFVCAWLAFAGLIGTTASTMEDRSPGEALGLALAYVGPLSLLAALVASRRRWILRPDRSLVRTAALLLAVGVVYAVVGGVASHAVLRRLADPDSPGEAGFGVAYQIVNAVFFYLILSGFLLWTESLRRFHEGRRLLDREAVLRAEAEARAIRAQFNPHFVFNTLHSLMLLVRSDPAAAERAIEDVAELIRYASMLQRREVDRVPLSKELAVIRRYLALERLRLDERLHVVWDVDEDVGDPFVPAFAVQTLVENAIRHGLEPSVEGGTITVEIRREGGVLAARVSDDGAGAEGAVEAEPGHGLDLLGQRLRALHGDAGRLSWDGRSGEGFRAEIRLPVEVADP